MLKAYVGVASDCGLSIFQPERAEAFSLIRRSVRPGIRLGFWAVIGQTDAETVNSLLRNGHHREAMILLDRCARDIGSILPSDLNQPSIH